MKKLTSVLAIIFALSFVAQSGYSQWSHRKKDAVIGGASGAVLGGLISHDHSKGAIIGGIAGAGTGYLIGRHKDRAYRTTTYSYAPARTYTRTYAYSGYRHVGYSHRHKRRHHHK